MELLYVWIENYKNIKNQDFNFSPKHWFDFKPKEEDGKVIGGTLHHKERNTNYPDNFFGKNISNVTAIVGKNGSGKSSLLDYIFHWHYPSAVDKLFMMAPPKVYKPLFHHQCIFLFKDDSENLKLFTTLNNVEHDNNIKTINDIESIGQLDNLERVKTLLEKGRFFPIYYSNIFSEDQMLSEIENPYIIRDKNTAEIKNKVDRVQNKINLSTIYQLINNPTSGPQENSPLINIIYNNYLDNQLHIAKFISDNKQHLGVTLPPYIFLGTNSVEKFTMLYENIKRFQEIIM